MRIAVRGGMILLGVEDDGSISGIKRPNLEEWIVDTVFAAMVHPLLVPLYEVIVLNDGKKVAGISFTEGTSKPYVVCHRGREDIYIRIGRTSRLATREQRAELFAGSGMLHTELLPVTGTTIQSLDRERLKDYLAGIIGDPEIPDSEDSWVRRLIGMGFLTDTSKTSPLCTIAGLLLFGLAPRRYLRQAGICVIVFSGTVKTYKAQLDEVIDGPLVGRWRR